MKKLYIATHSSKFYYNHAIAAGVIVDDNEYHGSKFQIYRITNGSFNLDSIKFIFSQDFIDILDTVYIDKYNYMISDFFNKGKIYITC